MGDGPEGRGSKIMRATRRASDSLSRIRRPGRGASPRSPLASAAVAAALASAFGVPKANLELIRGGTARERVFRVK